MKILIATVFLLGCASSVSADPAAKPRTPPPPKACPATGTPLFEVDHLTEGSKEKSIVKLYDSGALTIEATTPEGKTASSGSGCLDKDALAKVRADLKASPWQITHNQMHCMAVSANYKVYSVNGKQMYTARLCSPDVLDEKTAKNLQEIESLLK